MKRFFKSVTVTREGEGSFAVLLDGRPLRVAATKKALTVETETLANALAGEWRALPDSFTEKETPVTCFLSGVAALDADAKRHIINKIKACIPCDTLCCVAPEPERLRAYLTERFVPVLTQVNAVAATDFAISNALGGASVSEKSAAFADAYLSGLSDIALACVQRLAGEYGSFLLAYAVANRLIDAGTAFEISIAEETYQNLFWPADDAALAVRAAKREAVLFAEKVLFLSEEGK